MTLEKFVQKFPEIELQLLKLKEDGFNPEKPDKNLDQIFIDDMGVGFCQIYVSRGKYADYSLMNTGSDVIKPNDEYFKLYKDLSLNPAQLKDFKEFIEKERKEAEEKKRKAEEKKREADEKILAQKRKKLKQALRKKFVNIQELINTLDKQAKQISSEPRHYKDPEPQYLWPVIHSNGNDDPDPNATKCKIYFTLQADLNSDCDDYCHIYVSADGPKDYKTFKETYDRDNHAKREKFIEKYKDTKMDGKSLMEYDKVIKCKTHFNPSVYTVLDI